MKSLTLPLLHHWADVPCHVFASGTLKAKAERDKRKAQMKAALSHSRARTWTEQITALVHYCAGPSSSLKFSVFDMLALSMAAIN